MGKKYKIIIGIILGLILLVVVGSFILNSFLEKEIRQTISKELHNDIQTNDYDIKVNSLSGNVTISELYITLDHPSDSIKNSNAYLEKASLMGLSYWSYFFSDKIAFSSIKINGLDIDFYKDTSLPESEEEKKPFDEWISTNNFSLENSSILFEDTDGPVFLAKNLNFYLKDLYLNKATLKEKVPFQFSDLEVETSAMHFRMNDFDVLSLKDLSLLNNKLSVKDLTLQTVYEKNEIPADKDHVDLLFPSIEISDLYFQTIDTTFSITGKAMKFEDPKVIMQQGTNKVIVQQDKSTIKKAKKEIPIPFSMESFEINNASVHITKADESILLDIASLDFSLQDVLINNFTLQQSIPIHFQNLYLETSDLKYRLNPYDMLSFKQLSMVDNSLQITDLAIKTEFTRAALSSMLSKERDHMDLFVPSINLRDFYFVSEDTTFRATGRELTLQDPVFTIYRDKLVAEDTSIKPLYSKSIREIPFPLTLDSLFIKNASITYEERVKKDQPPGKVYFTRLNASVGNVSNTYGRGEKKTTIIVNTLFMDNTSLNVDWSFDVNDPNDKFNIKGEMGHLNATKMNSFTKSHLRVGIEGNISSTFFNINGNNDNSHIDFKINYDKLKVEILGEKDKKRWLPSAIANIFVSKTSTNKEGTFKSTEATAERNKDKSFFNYLWTNIMAGLKEVVVNI